MAEPKYRLHLRNYRAIKAGEGAKERRYVNIKDPTDTISVREFQARARRILVMPKPPKKRLTVSEKRARWMANHINRQTWLNDGDPKTDYISYEDAAKLPEFKYYESLIHSYDPDDRAEGYNYFEELEYEYEHEDWGDS